MQKKAEHQDGLSIVIPAYNEQDGIKIVLEQVQEVLAGWEFEVLVVDDGSEDQTAEVAQSVDGVRVVQHKTNRGYGAALKTGIQKARFNRVCITDADGTYPNDRILDLFKYMQEDDHDMVVGARVGKNVSVPLVRRPAKWVILQLARTVSGADIPDINSGLRVFKRSAARRFFSLLPDGFSFTTTITLGMLANGYSVGYLPISYYARVGKSKIRPVQDTLNFIQLILRIALYFSPLKIFIPLSGFFFILGIVWAGVSRWLFGSVADASMAVILMTAVQIAVVGMLAELINRRLPGLQGNGCDEPDGEELNP